MSVTRVFLLIGMMALGVIMDGCGLDGVRGTVVSIEENRYVVRDFNGKERRIYVDEHSHRDGAKAGNEVRVFVTKDGYAAYIQKIEQ